MLVVPDKAAKIFCFPQLRTKKKCYIYKRKSLEQKSFHSALKCIWQQCQVLLLDLIAIAVGVKDRGPILTPGHLSLYNGKHSGLLLV